jgi:hypothetical protein
MIENFWKNDSEMVKKIAQNLISALFFFQIQIEKRNKMKIKFFGLYFFIF